MCMRAYLFEVSISQRRSSSSSQTMVQTLFSRRLYAREKKKKRKKKDSRRCLRYNCIRVVYTRASERSIRGEQLQAACYPATRYIPRNYSLTFAHRGTSLSRARARIISPRAWLAQFSRHRRVRARRCTVCFCGRDARGISRGISV